MNATGNATISKLAQNCDAPEGMVVHHRPFKRFGTPAEGRWSHHFNLHRRCFYGPMYGNEQPYIARGITPNAWHWDPKYPNLADYHNIHHNWAKMASLLLAMSDLLGCVRACVHSVCVGRACESG